MKIKVCTLAVLAVFLTACSSSPNVDQCETEVSVDNSRDGYLVIGDSISIGYTPYLTNLVQSTQVTHTACNAESTANGIMYIPYWLKYRSHWKLITINHGYWDMGSLSGNATSITQYAKNLQYEVNLALAKSDKVIFVNTTAVIPEYTGIPGDFSGFDNTVIMQYNEAAEQVMQSLGVPVIDLYTPSLTISERDPSILHFLPSGYETLATALYQQIISLGGLSD